MDIEIVFERGENVQDWEPLQKNDSTNEMFWRQSQGGQIEMVQTLAEEVEQRYLSRWSSRWSYRAGSKQGIYKLGQRGHAEKLV